MAKYVFGLCEGRHVIPDVQNYLFGEIADPTDTAMMIDHAYDAIPQDCDELVVYVTGLTPAMLAVTTACIYRGITLTAMNFNRDTGDYLSQRVVTFTKCPWCGASMLSNAYTCPNCGAT